MTLARCIFTRNFLKMPFCLETSRPQNPSRIATDIFLKEYHWLSECTTFVLGCSWFANNKVGVCFRNFFSLAKAVGDLQGRLTSHNRNDAWPLSLWQAAEVTPAMTREKVVRKALDTFKKKCLRHVMRAIVSVRPRCSHSCVSLKEFPFKPVQILKHATRISTKQIRMRTKWAEHIAIPTLHHLVDVSDIFLFFSVRGQGKSRRRPGRWPGVGFN